MKTVEQVIFGWKSLEDANEHARRTAGTTVVVGVAPPVGSPQMYFVWAKDQFCPCCLNGLPNKENEAA